MQAFLVIEQFDVLKNLRNTALGFAPLIQPRL